MGETHPMSELWQANWNAPRPFVHPLRTPDGAVLSVDAPADHPWHHGLWSTIKFVNGDNFWEEYDAFGLLHATSVEELEGRTGPEVTAVIEWVPPAGEGNDDAPREPVLDECRSLVHVDIGPTAYAIDWTVELTPRVDVVLDRTPFDTWGGYGGLTLRGAPDWTDTLLVLADHDEPAERALGAPARWCHLQGMAPVGDTTAVAGVAILDHPENVRHPTPWYASTRADTYGEGWANFLNAAFLWDDALPVAAGDTLTLRHRVIVHDGDWEPGRVEEAWQRWVGGVGRA
jgi:hypothetical protein